MGSCDGPRRLNGYSASGSIKDISPKVELRECAAKASRSEMLEILQGDGVLIVRNFLTPEKVLQFNKEVDREFTAIREPGMSYDISSASDFWGSRTKRIFNLVTISTIFREDIIDNDLIHDVAREIFRPCGTYWMNGAEVIELAPGSLAQPLHRDNELNFPFKDPAPSLPELGLTFFVALTEFREENGATRLIPGSHAWPDFEELGQPSMAVPALLQPGDAMFLLGKTSHGAGANRTLDTYRRVMAYGLQPGFLTPEEASTLTVDVNLAKALSPRAQGMLGFRSQWPSHGIPLWCIDGREAGLGIGRLDEYKTKWNAQGP